jgi:type II secretory pathway pseudopilin PulG
MSDIAFLIQARAIENEVTAMTSHILKSKMSHRKAPPCEKGYALLSLIAAMTIGMIMLVSALPALKHEIQREREEEMFFRSQQIVAAIDRYVVEHGGQYFASFPTDLERLAELDPVTPSKRYLRISALRDPLSRDGKWDLIRPGDPRIRELARAYIETTKQPPQGLLGRLAPMAAGAISGLDNDGSSGLQIKDQLGPIVGVASSYQGTPIRNYYGIDDYTKALVMSGIALPGQFVIAGAGAYSAGGSSPQTPTDPRCPQGGIPLPDENGKIICTGVLIPGKINTRPNQQP